MSNRRLQILTEGTFGFGSLLCHWLWQLELARLQRACDWHGCSPAPPGRGEEPPTAAGPTPAAAALPARLPWQPLWHLLGWGWEAHGVIYTQVEQTRCNQLGFG